MNNFKEAAKRLKNIEKLEKYKTYMTNNPIDTNMITLAKIVTADYMCDIENVNNPKYRGIYKWWLRTKEKYKL